MRTINFTQTAAENTVANVTKVSPTFVTELKTAFRMFHLKLTCVSSKTSMVD